MKVGLGNSKRSNRVENQSFSSLRDFASYLEANRSGSDDGANFTPGPMRHGRRSAENAEPASVVCLDLDSQLSRADYERLCAALENYSAIAYETRKSTQQAPRVRVIVQASAEIPHDEYPAACAALAEDLSKAAGVPLVIDESCTKSEQLLFAPVPDREVTVFQGEPWLPSHPADNPAGSGSSRKISVDFHAALRIAHGGRNSALASIAGRMRRAGLTGDEIDAGLQQINLNRCEPPLPAVEVSTIARSIGRYEPAVPESREPLALIGFSAEEVLQPIRQETYLLPGLVPTDAYTLIAGGLSAYKSTLLHNLIVWRATGYDLLALGVDLPARDTGPCVLASYEDTDWRIFARLQRVLQNGHRAILATEGADAAAEFIKRAAKNIRRIPLTGRFRGSLVHRDGRQIAPNAEFLDELLAEVRAYTSEGVFVGIDPLRLAVVGSQNDDDGADVVVHVLNSIANELPGSGLVVCSHTTKQGAKEPGAGGYADASYATSGSASTRSMLARIS